MTRDPASRTRVLFVDDEPNIRSTLAPVLQQAGFEVHSSESVSDALFEINTNSYDILISDLNIGEEGDGFLVVSAMRHVQPACATFILTGYPAFETAIQAVHHHVDDYLVKPVDIASMVRIIRDKLESRRVAPAGSVRLAAFLHENHARIVAHCNGSLKSQKSWLQEAEVTSLLNALVEQMQNESDELSPAAVRSIAEYVKRLQEHGHSPSTMVKDLQCFSNVVYDLLQQNLGSANIAGLLSDLRRFHHALTLLIGKSLEGFARRQSSGASPA